MKSRSWMHASLAAPSSVYIERQCPRPANRMVPDAAVSKQRRNMVKWHQPYTIRSSMKLRDG